MAHQINDGTTHICSAVDGSLGCKACAIGTPPEPARDYLAEWKARAAQKPPADPSDVRAILEDALVAAGYDTRTTEVGDVLQLVARRGPNGDDVLVLFRHIERRLVRWSDAAPGVDDGA